MSEKEFKEYLKQIEAYKKTILSSTKRAEKFLKDVGVFEKSTARSSK